MDAAKQESDLQGLMDRIDLLIWDGALISDAYRNKEFCTSAFLRFCSKGTLHFFKTRAVAVGGSRVRV